MNILHCGSKRRNEIAGIDCKTLNTFWNTSFKGKKSEEEEMASKR